MADESCSTDTLEPWQGTARKVDWLRWEKRPNAPFLTPYFRPLGSLQSTAAQRLPLGVGFGTSLSFVQVLIRTMLLKFLLYTSCPSCLASSCPALVPVWTSLLAQTRLDTSQVSVVFPPPEITMVSCPGELDCTPGSEPGIHMPASGGWLCPPSA